MKRKVKTTTVRFVCVDQRDNTTHECAIDLRGRVKSPELAKKKLSKEMSPEMHIAYVKDMHESVVTYELSDEEFFEHARPLNREEVAHE